MPPSRGVERVFMHTSRMRESGAGKSCAACMRDTPAPSYPYDASHVRCADAATFLPLFLSPSLPLAHTSPENALSGLFTQLHTHPSIIPPLFPSSLSSRPPSFHPSFPSSLPSSHSYSIAAQPCCSFSSSHLTLISSSSPLPPSCSSPRSSPSSHSSSHPPRHQVPPSPSAPRPCLVRRQVQGGGEHC